ncbi:hypothetical protein ElyMa_005913700 [Elysia marginata]|uniref:Uncharacterized protein n=1 Tax=Elysia marginata TaxID=1093978 RepID=A0AAV4G8H2_9GAST|nr:hypothetical protein ElyMa_005913700 [Elysia marginata]
MSTVDGLARCRLQMACKARFLPEDPACATRGGDFLCSRLSHPGPELINQDRHNNRPDDDIAALQAGIACHISKHTGQRIGLQRFAKSTIKSKRFERQRRDRTTEADVVIIFLKAYAWYERENQNCPSIVRCKTGL